MTELHDYVLMKLHPKFVERYQKGYPLLIKEALQDLDVLKEEGQLIRLTDQTGRYVGTVYYGRQNKGYGWVLTQNETEEINPAFFTQRLAKALAFRARFFNSSDTTAFRVFNGEGDGIGGVTLDYFDGFYLFNWYSKGIYAYREPLIEALKSLVDYKGIYEKKRFDTKGQYIEDDDFVEGERATFPLVVKENGMNMAIYLNEGAMVGVFLDQRDVRSRIQEAYAAGRTVLNTFSYTGVFSVTAALGGASKTTSVDLANRSKVKTEEQFQINGIDPDSQDILVMDVFNYFNYAKRNHLSFDTVILDPPSFARSKKHTFSAEKNYKDLLKDAIAITATQGTIVASTNASSFGMKKFKGFIEQAFKEAGHRYKLVETFALPEDFRTVQSFPEGNYLKVVFIEKQD